VRPDAIDEQNKLMYVVAAGVDGGENHRERGTGTIVDDDPDSTSGMGLVVSDATVVEGDSGTPRTLVVPIALTNSATQDLFITWTTVDGTAVAGTDYTHKSGTVKIPQLGRQVNVSIPLLPNQLSQLNRTFSIQVTSAPGATVLDGTGTVTIRDDD
jgi:chitinase